MKSILINQNKPYHLAYLFLLILAMVACNSKNNEAELSKNTVNATTGSESTEANITVNSALNTNPNARIIRHATVKMQVNDFRKSLMEIENTIKMHQAFVSASNETHTDDKLENTLTIRVQAANLDLLLNNIIEHGVYLDYKNISSEDVSTEFVDISARIKSKKVVEERYLSFLKEAKNIKEMLELENEIRKIREEIEATQARINFLNEQTAYSTITLHVYQPTTVVAPTANSYWIRIINALGSGWEMLLSLIIGLLYIWPLILAMPAFVYFSRRFLHKYPPVR